MVHAQAEQDTNMNSGTHDSGSWGKTVPLFHGSDHESRCALRPGLCAKAGKAYSKSKAPDPGKCARAI